MSGNIQQIGMQSLLYTPHLLTGTENWGLLFKLKGPGVAKLVLPAYQATAVLLT